MHYVGIKINLPTEGTYWLLKAGGKKLYQKKVINKKLCDGLF
jgi:hypothetical protein